MNKEKEQIPEPKKELTEEEKARFFQLGMSFIDEHPAVAREYFKKSETPEENIEMILEGRGRKERVAKKVEPELIPEDKKEKKQTQKDVKKLYKEMIGKAKKEKDKGKVKFYKDGLKVLKKSKKKK